MTTARPTIKSLTAEIEALKKASANLKRSNTLLSKNSERYQAERDVAERTAIEAEATKDAEIEALKKEAVGVAADFERVTSMNLQKIEDLQQELRARPDNELVQLSDNYNNSQEQEFARQRDQANSALNAELEAAHTQNTELKSQLNEQSARGPKVASVERNIEERKRRRWERLSWICVALAAMVVILSVVRSCQPEAVAPIPETTQAEPQTDPVPLPEPQRPMTTTEIAEKLARGEEIEITSSFRSDNIPEIIPKMPQVIELKKADIAVVSMEWSNVRADPNGSADIKATLDPGTRVTIVDRSDEWYQIEWPGSGKAYMHRSVLSSI